MIAWCILWLTTLVSPGDGDREYAAGRFRAALQHYHASLADEPDGMAATLFKIGNCHFRLGEFAQAAWNYRRALLRAPRDRSMAFNLDRAELELGLVDREPDGIATTTRALWRSFTPNELLSLAGIAQFSFFAAAIAFRRHRKTKVALCAFAVAVTAIPLRVAYDTWWDRAVPGIVLAPRVPLRADPDPLSPLVTELYAGSQFDIVESSPRWLRVESPSGAGWIATDGVGRIE